jgi:hypothetical protein
MPGLVPGIHVLLSKWKKDVDGRDKPGHDDVDRYHAAGETPIVIPSLAIPTC